MIGNHHGWAGIVKGLDSDLDRLAPGLGLIDSYENHNGLPVFRYSTTGLTDKQAELAAKVVERAEKVAMETCAVCGQYGALSYSVDPPASGIRCDKHRGDWQAL